MIFQSKMNIISEANLSNHLEKAKDYIFWNIEINKWHSVDKIPASIIAEFFKIWDIGIIVKGMKIELDETDQYYRIIKLNKLL